MIFEFTYLSSIRYYKRDKGTFIRWYPFETKKGKRIIDLLEHYIIFPVLETV